MRKTRFVNGEFYHVFNRGIDKRDTFLEKRDLFRFFQSMEEFNTVKPIGSIYESHFDKNKKLSSKLVEFVCYCLNPNHYHFLLKQLIDDGIKKFMHRVGTGYTKYFNNKYDRTGNLFQKPFKAIHIDSNEYILHVSVYINLNNRVHRLGSDASKSFKSSWDEYLNNQENFCDKDIILEQFNNSIEYKDFAEGSLVNICERKEMEKFLLE